jgi:hypothetical protein
MSVLREGHHESREDRAWGARRAGALESQGLSRVLFYSQGLQ